MKTVPHLATHLLALVLLSPASARAASVAITNGTFDATNNTANGGINADGMINRFDGKIVKANRHVTLPP